MATAPPPIDPRGPRFNQAVLALSLVAGFVLDWRWVVPTFAVVLWLGAAFGPRWGPFLRLYAVAVRPRLRPPTELEDPRPPRFAAAVGVLFLVGASAAFAAGSPGLGWVLALLVAALAGLAATTGICIGCEVYLWIRTLTGRRRVTGRAAVPGELLEGAERTWVIFTTPYCATCGPVEARLRTADPAARIVKVDATRQTALATAFRIRTAPTALLADRRGAVHTRLVGAAAVDRYVGALPEGEREPLVS